MLSQRHHHQRACVAGSTRPCPQALKQLPLLRARHSTLLVAAASPSDAAAVAQDTANSNGTTPQPLPAATTTTPSATPSPSSTSLNATKIQLLEELAALDRGTLATPTQKGRVELLVSSLEQHAAAAGSSDPFSGSPAPVEGRWQLIYNSKAVFTASPFFPAFQNGLVQDQGLAEAIFAFTDAIPGASIGTAMQTVSLLSNSLISEVDMTVFPGFTGTVVTSSRLQVLSPTRLALDVHSTRVANSSFSPFLDGVSVPVEQLMEAVRGVGCTRVIYDVTFVDESLRVTRCGDQLLLHRKV